MATESKRTVIEPTRVIGPLRTARRLDDDELFRPTESAKTMEPTQAAKASEAPQASPPPPPPPPDDDTEVLDLRPHRRPAPWRRARLSAIIAASIGGGFILALVLTARIVVPASPTAPQSSAGPSARASASAQPQAAVLRQGDSGTDVSDLQSRLLQIPDVYPDGRVDGRYDTVLAAAVARFQLWYGIRGDEDGEYGDATRRDLESRTTATGTGS
ncbi:peptidoglycan-binding protein [Streptomyces sp. NPDC059373]